MQGSDIETFLQQVGWTQDEVEKLVAPLSTEQIISLALEARRRGYRKQSLAMLVVLANRRQLRHEVLERVLLRPDDLSDFLDMYWQKGRVPIAKQIKVAMSNKLPQFSTEELRQYDTANPRVRVRDVMFLTRPRPKNPKQEREWRQWIKTQAPRKESCIASGTT